MRWMKWLGITAAIALIITCYFPWIIVPVRQIVISGIHAEGTNYGRPGYLAIVFSIIFILFALIRRLWAMRVNILIAALNFSWALRNFILLSRCEGGECPERLTAFYLYFTLAFILLIFSLFTSDDR